MNRKIRIVFFVCSLTVIVFTVWSLVRSLRPSRGKAYERLSVEEAFDYMSYETGFCIVDVRDKADYDLSHAPEAVNLPVDEMVEHADEVIPDRHMMLYVYGDSSRQSCAGAQKLSDIGFTSVTETGSYRDWLEFSPQQHSSESVLPGSAPGKRLS